VGPRFDGTCIEGRNTDVRLKPSPRGVVPSLRYSTTCDEPAMNVVGNTLFFRLFSLFPFSPDRRSLPVARFFEDDLRPCSPMTDKWSVSRMFISRMSHQKKRLKGRAGDIELGTNPWLLNYHVLFQCYHQERINIIIHFQLTSCLSWYYSFLMITLE
jgi:hypothetical protein